VSVKASAASEILRVIPKVMRILASEMRQQPEGLAPAHFRLMLMLARQPRSLTELAESQAVSLATMSNSISVLEERGWVERKKDPADRRKLALEITSTGRKVLSDVRKQAEDHLDDLLAVMNHEQCQDLLRGLELLNSVFEGHVDLETELRSEAK
jgi:DNA-binding MarR family transcriptional regulator